MTSFDWDGARRRLEAARLALADEPSPEEQRALLGARARALAEPLPDPEPEAELRDVVVFSVCGERFAVDAGEVGEAVPLGRPTPIPGTPDHLLGIVNHRGRALPVFDLRPRLVAGGSRDGELTHAVAVETEGLSFGIAAEAVEETSRERAQALEHGLVTVLDLEALAAEARLRIDDE